MVRCLRSAFARASGGKADAMTGDISARRGALPIKNQRRLTTMKWLMALNYSRGPRGEVTSAKRHTGRSRRLRVDLDFHDPTYPAVTVLSLPSPVPPWNRRGPASSPRPGLLHARCSLQTKFKNGRGLAWLLVRFVVTTEKKKPRASSGLAPVGNFVLSAARNTPILSRVESVNC